MPRPRFRFWISITIATLCILCGARDMFSQGSAGHDTLPIKKDSTKSKPKHKIKPTPKPQPKTVPKVAPPILPHRVNPQPKLERQNTPRRKPKPSMGESLPTRDPSNKPKLPAPVRVNSARAAKFLRSGKAQMEKGEFDRAISDLTNATLSDPKLAEAYFCLGNIYNKREKFDTAIENYSRALEITPDYPDAYNNRGSSYLAKLDIEAAINDFNQAAKLLGDDKAKIFNNRGIAYRKLRKYEEAVRDFDEAITFDPTYFKAFLGRGQTRLAQMRYQEAIEDCNQSLVLQNAASAEPSGFKTTAKKCSVDALKQLEDYQKLVQINPVDGESYRQRGNVRLNNSRFDLAIKDYEAAIERFKLEKDVPTARRSLAHLGRGVAFYSNRYYEDAIKDFDTAIGLDDTMAEAYCKRGLAKAGQKDTDGALADYILAIQKGSKDAYYKRALLQIEKGNLQEAEKDLREYTTYSENKDFYVLLDLAFVYDHMSQAETTDAARKAEFKEKAEEARKKAMALEK